MNLKRLLDFSGNDPLLDLHKRLPNREGKNPLKLASGRLALVSKSLQFLGLYIYIYVIYDVYIYIYVYNIICIYNIIYIYIVLITIP